MADDQNTTAVSQASLSIGRPLNGAGFDHDRLFSIFFFAVYIFLIYQLAVILRPFLAPLLSAVMLALVVFPLRQLVFRLIESPTLASLLTTVLVTFTIVVPLAFLTWMLIREASAAIPVLKDWLATQPFNDSTNVSDHLPDWVVKGWADLAHYMAFLKLNLKDIASEAIQNIGNRATLAGAAIVQEFFVLIFQIVIFLFALFFFLRDGPRIIVKVLDLVPMEAGNKRLVLDSLDRTLVGMVRGTAVTASAQGMMTGIGLAIFGAPFPILLGFAATFLAIVPFVGAAIVWVPAAIYLILIHKTAAAIGLILWGLLIVGLIDNVLRPIVVGEHTHLPITLLFLGVLGGVQVYGLIGGLVSPLLIACVVSFARIYRQHYVEP